jgi:hypothetical protein
MTTRRRFLGTLLGAAMAAVSRWAPLVETVVAKEVEPTYDWTIRDTLIGRCVRTWTDDHGQQWADVLMRGALPSEVVCPFNGVARLEWPGSRPPDLGALVFLDEDNGLVCAEHVDPE